MYINFLNILTPKIRSIHKNNHIWNIHTLGDIRQLGPRYEGQLTRMAEPKPILSAPSYTLTTSHHGRSTDGRAGTDRTCVRSGRCLAHPFSMSFVARGWCISRASCDHLFGPQHELPPAMGWCSTDRPLPRTA